VTEHDKDLEALARQIRDLSNRKPQPSRRMEYIALTLLVSFLLIFDTQTWLQRIFLLLLALTAASLLWFGDSRRVGQTKRTGFLVG
jgi:hypothetical protein